jgi:hypothetical protein
MGLNGVHYTSSSYILGAVILVLGRYCFVSVLDPLQCLLHNLVLTVYDSVDCGTFCRRLGSFPAHDSEDQGTHLQVSAEGLG